VANNLKLALDDCERTSRLRAAQSVERETRTGLFVHREVVA
jgi:hypothetical protein